MAAMNTGSVLRLIERARMLALSLEGQVGRAPVYRLVLDQLTEVERALNSGAVAGFEAARPLGVIAVRELDGVDGAANDLGQLIFQIRDSLRRLAGLPYHA